MTRQIVDLDAFIIDVVGYVETEGKGPTTLGFAGGKSGMSYGNAQNDCEKNPLAAQKLRKILIDDGVPGADADDIVLLAATPGITETTFRNAGYYDIVKNALKNQGTLVAEMDAISFAEIRPDIAKAIAAAAKNKHGRGALDPSNPDPEAIAWMAVWSNSSGNLDDLSEYVAGQPKQYNGKVNIIPGAPSAANIYQYIADQAEAKKRPTAFTNRKKRVQDGLKLAMAHQQLIANPPPGKTPRRMNQNLPGGPVEGTTRLADEVDHEDQSIVAADGAAAPASTSASMNSAAADSSPASLSGAQSIPVSLSVDSLPTPSLLAASAPASETSASGSDAQATVDVSSSASPATDTDMGLGGKFRLARARTELALRNLMPARSNTGSPGAGPSGGAQPSLPSVLPGLDRGLVFDVPAGAESTARMIEATPPRAAGDLGGQRIETIEAKERVAEDTAQPVAEVETDASATFDAAEEALEAEIAAALTAIETLRRARRRFPGITVDRDRNVIALTSISATAPSAAPETGAGDDGAGGSPYASRHPEPPLTEKRVRQLIRDGINKWDSRFGVRFRSRHITMIRDR